MVGSLATLLLHLMAKRCENLSHHTLSSGLRSDSTEFMMGTVSSEHLGFCFFIFLYYTFLFFFGSVLQTKLAIRHLFGARKYSLSYRIVLRRYGQ